MKKEYQQPEIEIEEIEVNDIMLTSSETQEVFDQGKYGNNDATINWPFSK